jgi:enamine deaminase RidA (YjgF/YER057c/UK114 family)
MVAARGFSHAVVPVPGKTVYVAGQIGVDADGRLAGPGLVVQFDAALGNVVTALAAAGAAPEHVVAMNLYTTTMDEYRTGLAEIGTVWRKHMGRHYPAMAMLGVIELVEPAAVIEIVTVAVVPDD